MLLFAPPLKLHVQKLENIEFGITFSKVTKIQIDILVIQPIMYINSQLYTI